MKDYLLKDNKHKHKISMLSLFEEHLTEHVQDFQQSSARLNLSSGQSQTGASNIRPNIINI